MTLKIELIDPENESPLVLRAVGRLLIQLASDKDGGEPGDVIRVAPAGAYVGNAQPDAPFVSTGTTPPPPPPPAAPAQQESTTVDGAELDKNGLPWDARIHASTKGKNQDGTWKALRGVDKSIVPGIEAELRAALGNAASSEIPPPPPVVATASTNAPAGVTAGDVFKRINELRKGGHADLLPQPQLDMALMSVGLGTLPDFMKEVKVKPELAASFLEAINAAALPEDE